MVIPTGLYSTTGAGCGPIHGRGRGSDHIKVAYPVTTLTARLGLIVVPGVNLTQECVLVGQRKLSPQNWAFFPCSAHVDPHIECTGELRNGICRKKTRLNSNKRCIPAILTHFNKMTTSHKIASLKTTKDPDLVLY